jgi:hypothetical protein
MSRLRLVFVSFAVALVAGAAFAQPVISVQADADSPHGLVIRHFGWAERGSTVSVRWVSNAAAADVAVVSASSAVAQRASGADLKAVYVVSRTSGSYKVLAVSERLLESQGATLEQLIALHEQARRWIIANPAQARLVVARELGITQEAGAAVLAELDFNVSRPGPALAHSLKAAGAAPGVVDALLDDAPLRAAVRGVELIPRQTGEVALLR